MDDETFKAAWPVINERVSERWRNMPREELEKIDGKYDAFVTMVSESQGQTQDEAKADVDAWFDLMDPDSGPTG